MHRHVSGSWTLLCVAAEPAAGRKRPVLDPALVSAEAFTLRSPSKSIPRTPVTQTGNTGTPCPCSAANCMLHQVLLLQLLFCAVCHHHKQDSQHCAGVDAADSFKFATPVLTDTTTPIGGGVFLSSKTAAEAVE